MLQPPCWDSAPSHMQDRPWLGWSHSLISAFPYSCIQMSLMIQTLGTWHVLFPGKPIVCWCLKYHSLLLPGSCRKQRQPGVVSTIYLHWSGGRDLSLQSQPARPQVSSVLLTGQNLHGLQWVSAHADWMQSHLLLTLWIPTARGWIVSPQNLSPPETCERTLIWKLGLLQK